MPLLYALAAARRYLYFERAHFRASVWLLASILARGDASLGGIYFRLFSSSAAVEYRPKSAYNQRPPI